ncbi:MAG TPA: phosphoadenosine phosphosulfate reductase family protein [Nakamurella sp.]
MQPSQPGLDITTLRRLVRPGQNTAGLVDRIADHLDAHDGYVAFSGGKDSLVVVHLTLQAEPNVPVVFFDSGLEYPETITYLDQVAEQLGIPDGIEIEPAVPDLLTLLIRTGTWGHHLPNRDFPDDVRTTLITQPAAQAHRRHGPGELWGVRASESDARRRLYLAALNHHACGCCRAGRRDRAKHGGVITRRDGTTAFSPIWDWTDDDVWNYLARHRLPLNPVYDKLRLLGAPDRALRLTSLLDAHPLRHGRAVWLRRGWPNVFTALQEALPRLSELT